MREDLYHKDIGFPRYYQRPTGVIHPAVTWHAENAAKYDPRGPLELPTTIDMDAKGDVPVERMFLWEAVELGFTSGRLSKLVIRSPTTPRVDIIAVLRPELAPMRGGSGWVLVTCWSNWKEDQHNTLKRHHYVDPKAAHLR